MRHSHLGRYSFPSWNSSWMSCRRSCPFQTIQTSQHTSDSAESKYSSSQTNKGQAPCHGWLESWHKSWIVVILTWSKAPTAEPTGEIEHIWSPCAMMALYFKTIWQNRRRNNPNPIPFKAISPPRWNVCLSKLTPVIWMSDPCHLMNLTYLKHPIHHLQHHPSGTTYPDHHHIHHHIFVIKTIISGAQLRGFFIQRQEKTPVWTSFHQTPWCWQRTHTQTFSNIEGNYPLHHTNLRDRLRPKSGGLLALCDDSFQDHFGGILEIGANWLISRVKVDFFQDHLEEFWKWVQIDSFQDHLFVCSTKLTPFKTITLNYTVFSPLGVTLLEIVPFRIIHIQCISDSFQDHPWIVWHIQWNWLLSRPFERGKEQYDTLQFI